MSGLRRREFITLVGSAAAVWPLAARAQQPEGMRRVGVLMAFAENDPEAQASITTFRQAPQKLGWSDGRNVRIDCRWGGADRERISGYANRTRGLEAGRDPSQRRASVAAAAPTGPTTPSRNVACC